MGHPRLAVMALPSGVYPDDSSGMMPWLSAGWSAGITRGPLALMDRGEMIMGSNPPRSEALVLEARCTFKSQFLLPATGAAPLV